MKLAEIMARITEAPSLRGYRVGIDKFLNRDQSERTPAESIVRSFEEIANELKGLRRFNGKVNRAQTVPHLTEISGWGLGGMAGVALFTDWAKDLVLNLPLPSENTLIQNIAIAGLSSAVGMRLVKRQLRSSKETRVMYQYQKRIGLYRAFAEFTRLKEELENASKLPALDQKQTKRVYRSLRQIYNSALSIDVSTKRKEWQMRNDPQKAGEHQEILQEAQEELEKMGFDKLTEFFGSPYDSPEKKEEIQKPISLVQQLDYRFRLNPDKARSYANQFAQIGEGNELVQEKVGSPVSTRLRDTECTKLGNKIRRSIQIAKRFASNRREKKREKKYGKVNPSIHDKMLIAFERDGKYFARGGVIAKEVNIMLDKIITKHEKNPATIAR